MFNINPFIDEDITQEIEFYGLKSYNDDHISVETVELIGRCDDYFNVNFRTGNLKVPIFKIDGSLWMSLTPMEIQSQWIAINTAKGKVGIGGLGMGYALLRIMEKEEVTSVDVWEINPHVIKFFKSNFRIYQKWQRFIH